jgi:hypothetical protein
MEEPDAMRGIAVERAAAPVSVDTPEAASALAPVERSAVAVDRLVPAEARGFGAVKAAEPVVDSDPTAASAFAPVDRATEEASRTAPSAARVMPVDRRIVAAAVAIALEASLMTVVRAVVPDAWEAPDACIEIPVDSPTVPVHDEAPAATRALPDAPRTPVPLQV